MNKKNAFILSLGILILVCSLGGVYAFIRYGKNSASNVSPRQKTGDVTSVQEQFSEALCAGLTETEARDVCFVARASEQHDASVCKKVNDVLKQTSCINSVSVYVAVEQKNIAPCLSLTEPVKSSCLNAVYQTFADVGACSSIEQQFQSRCLDIVTSVTAKEISDCQKISALNIQDACMLRVQGGIQAGIIDSDKDTIPDSTETQIYRTNPNKSDTDDDGFTDREEIFRYHTDPLNADSDGDGFSDNAEVKQGYDPLGPGSASIIQPKTP